MLSEGKRFQSDFISRIQFCPCGSSLQPRIFQQHRAAIVYRGWQPLPQMPQNDFGGQRTIAQTLTQINCLLT
jgi:hypothetical protein